MTYKLPHLLDRPHQQETLDWILNSNKKYLILCAPTGFGKSPLPAATSLGFKTLVLVLHKSLQNANYKQQYGFDILYGKSNYPCEGEEGKYGNVSDLYDIPHDRKYWEVVREFKNEILPQKLTAYDCDLDDCDCPYQEQKRHCHFSQRVSLNYAKFLSDKPFTEIMQPEYLYCDEAHNLPDTVMNFVGLSLDWDNEFAQCNGGIKPSFESRLNYNEAMELFRQYARVIHSNKPEQKKDLARWRKWKRLNQRIEVTNSIISNGNLEDWYYETDHKSLIIRPLTAKYHFKRLFNVANKIVMMSATITPQIAERLGIEPDEFDFMEVPNVWPVPTRLIYDLGGPAINWKSSEEDKQENVNRIASVLNLSNSGIIHVTSKSQAYQLQSKLGNLLEHLEFFTPTNGIGTNNQYQEWQDTRIRGCYCISWNFHEGVDLGQDEINILAKVPYAGLGGNYEQAKVEYDPDWYLIKTAYKFMQALGRNRRGIAEHYLPGARQVFIADSAWHRLKSWLPSDFLRSIRRWNGR